MGYFDQTDALHKGLMSASGTQVTEHPSGETPEQEKQRIAITGVLHTISAETYHAMQTLGALPPHPHCLSAYIVENQLYWRVGFRHLCRTLTPEELKQAKAALETARE